MNPYILTVKHDEGIQKIRVNATDEAQAKTMVMKAEGCPECAIIRIRKARYIKKTEKVNVTL